MGAFDTSVARKRKLKSGDADLITAKLVDAPNGNGGGIPAEAAKLGAPPAALDSSLILPPEFVRYAFVNTGYRYNYSWTEGLLGVFSFHAETLNIWTHLLGFAYFLWAIPRVAAAMEAGNATFMDRCYYWGFLGGAMVQMLTSTVYHIFRCMSEAWEAALLRLDLIGVVAMIGGAYAVALYNGFWCHPTWHVVYLSVLILLLGTSCGLMMFPAFQEPRWMFLRNMVLASTVAFGIIPALHWSTVPDCDEQCRWRFVESLTKMFACYGIGFLCFSFKIPERWWPGKFDVFGASHQLWHIFVWAAGAAWLDGMLDHFAWRAVHLQECPDLIP